MFVGSSVYLVVIHTVMQEIRKGADVTRADNKGRTALHFAATRGDTNMGIGSTSTSVVWVSYPY